MLLPMTLSNLERGTQRVQFFSGCPLTYARTVSPTATKFGMVTHLRRGVFLADQRRHNLRRGG